MNGSCVAPHPAPGWRIYTKQECLWFSELEAKKFRIMELVSSNSLLSVSVSEDRGQEKVSNVGKRTKGRGRGEGGQKKQSGGQTA